MVPGRIKRSAIYAAIILCILTFTSCSLFTTPTDVDATQAPAIAAATSTPAPSPRTIPTWTRTPTRTSTPMPTLRPTRTPRPTATPFPPTTTPTPVVMIYVPGGEFQIGSDDDEVDYALQLCNEYYGDCERTRFSDEQPAHTVMLDAFWIDQTEVTNGQYRRCVEMEDCNPPKDSGSHTRASYYGNSAYDDYPVIWVNWHQAAAYCEWAGARLPTVAEWEYAARGPEGWVFPWGDTFDGMRLNFCDANCEYYWADKAVGDGYADTAPVGSFPDGASWCEALDMAGNVWEWVADWYGDYPSETQRNPIGPAMGESKVLRGGSWSDAPDYVRSAFRGRSLPGIRNFNLGFRCAKDAE